jgi:ABC-2 type transport system permease protein
MNGRRVAAVVRRQFFVTIHSPTRLIHLAFWPVIDLVLWGMITVFLSRSDAELPVPVTFFLGGVILWDLVFRAKNGVAMCLLEEVHSRNLISVMASPITPGEYLAGAVAVGFAKLAVTWSIMAGLAWALFSFGVLEVGVSLAVYVTVLLAFGVALGLTVIGFVLRFGYAADELAWALAAIVVPFAAVFYPVRSLPGWAQAVATFVPPAHAFEAMRANLADRAATWGSVPFAFLLDALYIAAAFWFARRMFTTLLRRGLVTRYM